MSDKQSYQRLKSQLDNVLNRLQAEDVDIDEAVKLHEQGQQLVKQLEKYLEATSLKITKLSKK